MASETLNPCPQCGFEIPRSLEGNCPACLLRPSLGISNERKDRGFPKIAGYELTDKLGEGGFGIVYRAEQLEPIRRPVAIKLLKAGMDTAQVMARFEAERQALALMDHPNIATIYDAGESDEGRPFFAMELVEGIPLNEHCDENDYSLLDRLGLFLTICEAVGHAHQKGVIHRDLKPGNILVGESLKVIDFGIAKATEQVLSEDTILTGEAQMLGTPEYMSPEQAEGGGLGLDTRTDVYALGALLYELIAGSPPFSVRELEKRGFLEILRVIQEDEPARPSTRLSQVVTKRNESESEARVPEKIHDDLDWIVLKALEKNRERRYGTVSEFAADLQRFLSDEPVVARPPSRWYLIQKFVKRNRLMVSAVVMVALAIVVGGVFSSVMAWREAQANQRAQEAAAETRETYSHSDFLIAGKLMEEGKVADGVAYLARAVRTNPENEAASFKLLATLVNKTFAREVIDPVELEARASHLRFSPDGSKVIVASVRGRGEVWQLGEAGRSRRNLVQHSQADYTPTASDRNGTRLVIGSQRAGVEVFDLSSGEKLAGPFSHSGSILREVAMSPDGKFAFSTGNDGCVRAIDVDGDRAAWVYRYVSKSTRSGNPSRAVPVVVSDDGTRLLAGFGDGAIAMLDAATGEVIHQGICHDTLVWKLAFLPGETERFASASYGGTARVWHFRARAFRGITRPLHHTAWIYDLKVSPCGTRMATASYDGTAVVWDTASGRRVTAPLKHRDHVYDVAFSPDGLRLATASRDHLARVWDVATGELVVAPIVHDHTVNRVAFSPDGRSLLTSSRDAKVRLWDIRRRASWPLEVKHRSAVHWVGFDTDDSSFVTWEPDGRASEWRTSDGGKIGLTIPLPKNPGLLEVGRQNDGILEAFDVEMARGFAKKGMLLFLKTKGLKGATCIGVNAKGEVMLVGYADGRVIAWDLLKADKLQEFQLHQSAVLCVDLDRDGKRAIVGARDGTARLLDLESGPIGGVMKHEEAISCVMFDSSAEKVATSSQDGSSRIWDASSGEAVTGYLEHADQVHPRGLFCKFSPDGKLLASAGSLDGQLRVWDCETGKVFGNPLNHAATVTAFRFSQDGQRIVTGTVPHDGKSEVNVWDVKSGEQLSPPLRKAHEVVWVSFDHQGRRVATAYGDGLVSVWDQAPLMNPVPDFLPELAEAMVGRRLAEDGRMESLPVGELKGGNGNSPWFSWLMSSPLERTISPESGLQMEKLIAQVAEDGEAGGVREALFVAPGKRSLLKRVAEILEKSKSEQSRKRGKFLRERAGIEQQ